MHRLLVPLLLVPLAGCYSHSLVPADSVPPGAEVRARITAVQVDRLATVLPVDDRVLTGTVVASGSDELLLEVVGPTAQAGRASRRLHQRIALPFGEIVEVEVRRLDKLRTAGLALAGAAIVGAIAIAQLGDDEHIGSPPPEGGPNALRLPLDLTSWLGAALGY
ncbi:MAG: hypothetical protein ACRELV_17560 [Longimicrobiales bacterium]